MIMNKAKWIIKTYLLWSVASISLTFVCFKTDIRIAVTGWFVWHFCLFFVFFFLLETRAFRFCWLSPVTHLLDMRKFAEGMRLKLVSSESTNEETQKSKKTQHMMIDMNEMIITATTKKDRRRYRKTSSYVYGKVKIDCKVPENLLILRLASSTFTLKVWFEILTTFPTRL